MSADRLIGVDARSLLATSRRGEGRTLLRLYEEIGRLRPDWRFVLYGQSGHRDAIASIPRARASVFDMPGFRFNLWENLGLPWRTARDRVALLHASSSGAPAWSRVPIVMTVHDVIPLVFDDGQDSPAVERFRKQLRYGLSLARSIVAVSEHTKRDLTRLFGTSAERVVVIPWGVDPAPPVEAAPTAHPYFLMFGGDAKRKNTLETVRAFLRVAQRLPRHRLSVIGLSPGRVREQVVADVVAAGMGERVDVHDYMPDADVEGLLMHATGLLYLSRYEGFGLPVLEAMSHGIPVVAANRTSLPEVAGSAALLVDPDRPEEVDAAVIRLAEDRDLREELARRSRSRAAQFTWESTARATIRVFELALRDG